MNEQNQSSEQNQNVPKKKAWYKKWWVIIIGVIVFIGVIGSAGEDKTTKQPVQEQTQQTTQKIDTTTAEKENDFSEKIILNLCLTDPENADVWKQMGINLFKNIDDPLKGSENIPACESIEIEVLEKRNINDIERYKVKYGKIEGWQTERLLMGEKILENNEITPQISVTSIDIAKDYSENEVAADEKYKGKIIEISGKISSIDNGTFDDEMIIKLSDGQYDFSGPICYMEKSEREKVLALKKGASVTLIGEGNSATIGSPMLKNCTIE
jgi:enamine deaminase RidA (YjgF/YER057c/UK114 family)